MSRVLPDIPLLQCSWGTICLHTFHTRHSCDRTLVQYPSWTGYGRCMHRWRHWWGHISSHHSLRCPQNWVRMGDPYHRTLMCNTVHSCATFVEDKATSEHKSWRVCGFSRTEGYQVCLHHCGYIFGRVRCFHTNDIYFVIWSVQGDG